MAVGQSDFNILSQQSMKRYIKVFILNFKYQIVNEISGNVVNCSVNVDADSDIRRTCSVEMVVESSDFDVKPGSNIWLDKFIQPYIGILDTDINDIRWYNQGIYLINAPSYSYNSTTNHLSFQGVDLMSKLTGLRNGELEGIPTVIPQDSSVRNAIISTIQLGGFTKYIVNDCLLETGVEQKVPYDIEVKQGSTVYDLLQELRDILPNYEMFFDPDGVFVYQKIPSGKNAPVLIDDTTWKDIVIEESINTDFESVKNYIEVYGMSHDIDHYSTETTVSGANISLTIESVEEYSDNLMIGFTPLSNVTGDITLNINNMGAKNLVNSSGESIKSLDKDVYYVALYRESGVFTFLGHQQAQAIAFDDNPSSPFYIDGSVGVIRSVKCGGEYDNIYSDELAMQRAKLEIYWACRLNDTITISCIPIPWLDVNTVISHAPRGGEQAVLYIIKNFSIDYNEDGLMSITAATYYPYYDFI